MQMQNPSRNSERGFTLIVVLLLMAVLSGVAIGFAMQGQVEAAMASNEVDYAGARAAAEAAINRASEAITELSGSTTNLLAEAVAADGDASFLFGGGPLYTIGASGDFSYSVAILDDDDPDVYEGEELSPEELLVMEEDNDPNVDQNDILVLRATGFGPNNTRVIVARIIKSDADDGTELEQVTTNPAILVDGDLTISGNPTVDGANGSVHANGNLLLSGSPYIQQNATASGTITTTGNPDIDGTTSGNRPEVTVPTVTAADYLQYATHLLKSDGTVRLKSTNAIVTGTGWTYTASTQTWAINGNTALTGAYYVEGGRSAKITGNPGSAKSPLALSIISTGSIEVAGNPYLYPHSSTPNLQFVAQTDLKLAGNVDVDITTVEGQSLVGEQLMISGNPDIRGQIIVKNSTSTSNLVTSNTISGNPQVTYNGSFDGIVDDVEVEGETTYDNQILGWIER